MAAKAFVFGIDHIIKAGQFPWTVAIRVQYTRTNTGELTDVLGIEAKVNSGASLGTDVIAAVLAQAPFWGYDELTAQDVINVTKMLATA